MFEQAILDNANANRRTYSTRAWTTGLGLAGEAAAVAFVVLAPLIWPQSLPKPQALLTLLTPAAPPAHVVAVKPRSVPSQPGRMVFDAATLPRSIPNKIEMTVEEPPAAFSGMVASTASDDRNALLDGIIGGAGPLARSTPREKPVEKEEAPKPAKAAAEPRRNRTSSIELARLIYRVEPIYPAIAKAAHVSGTVEITGVIGVDGRIRELKAINGNPLLVKAALDAVSQWVYAPPVLNGERIEIVAPISVKFILNQ